MLSKFELIFFTNKGKKILPEIYLPIKVKLLRTPKKGFCNNLNVKRITNNRKFWKTIISDFTSKTQKDEKMTIVDRGNRRKRKL